MQQEAAAENKLRKRAERESKRVAIAAVAALKRVEREAKKAGPQRRGLSRSSSSDDSDVSARGNEKQHKKA